MTRPYHIVAPAYTERSAGAKALHMLCHHLNGKGQKAFIVPMGVPVVSPFLDTPLAKAGDANAIVVYPEIIEGNPLGAKDPVRWLLYYAGRYRGNKTFPKTDRVWGYTTRIARDYGTQNVMFLPTVNDLEFTPLEGAQRSGSCFYAHKYREFYGQTPAPRGVEITNPGQSRDEIIRLLQTSEVFYAYEDTALIIEAVLCGCPVVCVPSASFTECCGLDDFSAGIAWGVAELPKAKKTLRDARRNYVVLKDLFQAQLTKFIKSTQA